MKQESAIKKHYDNINQVLRVNKNTLVFGANLILLDLTMNVVAYHFPLCDNLLAGTWIQYFFWKIHNGNGQKGEKLVV